jgi:hypothetical protein
MVWVMLIVYLVQRAGFLHSNPEVVESPKTAEG